MSVVSSTALVNNVLHHWYHVAYLLLKQSHWHFTCPIRNTFIIFRMSVIVCMQVIQAIVRFPRLKSLILHDEPLILHVLADNGCFNGMFMAVITQTFELNNESPMSNHFLFQWKRTDIYYGLRTAKITIFIIYHLNLVYCRCKVLLVTIYETRFVRTSKKPIFFHFLPFFRFFLQLIHISKYIALNDIIFNFQSHCPASLVFFSLLFTSAHSNNDVNRFDLMR